MKAFKVLRKFNGKKMKVNPNNPLKSLINTENQQFRFFLFDHFQILEYCGVYKVCKGGKNKF